MAPRGAPGLRQHPRGARPDLSRVKHRHELRQIQWLQQVIVEPRRCDALLVPLLAPARQRDQHHLRAPGLGAQMARRSQPSMPGMPMSSTAMSNRSELAQSRAPPPRRRRRRQSRPSDRNNSAKLSAASRLSSTTRIAPSKAVPHRPAMRCRDGVITRTLFASGSRTVNSAPWPRPSLAASTLPPCSSTRLLTSVSPMPSPPCAALRSRRSPARTCRRSLQHVRRHADAGVAHLDHG